MSEVLNARIAGTFLGIEDHGIFIMSIMTEAGSRGQGYQRILGADAGSLTRIRNLIEVVGVQSWEELKGKYCRIRIVDGLIQSVGHIIDDRWTAEAHEE